MAWFVLHAQDQALARMMSDQETVNPRRAGSAVKRSGATGDSISKVRKHAVQNAGKFTCKCHGTQCGGTKAFSADNHRKVSTLASYM
jgi:hypothetical protein